MYGNAIIDSCKENPAELERLQDQEYSKETFGLSKPYQFCIKVNEIPEDPNSRYWKQKESDTYHIFNMQVRICSQWASSIHGDKKSELFQQYLLKKKLITKEKLSEFDIIASGQNKFKKIKKISIKANTSKSQKNARYRGWAIGNAQNVTIRNILSNLGLESFNANDWNKTKGYFDNKCAYCGSPDELVMEHAIPINREKLGEHRLGNIIPSCSKCNSEKSSKDYKEFLGSDNERIDAIEKYMAEKNYTPITDSHKIKVLLEQAYADVGQVADKYIKEINEALSENNET